MHFNRMAGALASASFAALAAPAFADTAPPSTAQTQTLPPAAPAPVTDAELANFAAARAEIEPLSRQAQTPDTLTQMRASLQRHNLTGARYNEIVAAVQASPALQQRLASLTPHAQPPG